MYKSLLITVALLAAGATAQAKPPHGESHGKASKKEQQHDRYEKQQHTRFSKAERQTLRGYYDNLPPGLAKKYRRTGTLPPGWEAKVQPGQVLSREDLRLARPLPRELLESLEPGPVGSTVIQLHDHILRIHEKSREILDSILLPIRP